MLPRDDLRALREIRRARDARMLDRLRARQRADDAALRRAALAVAAIDRHVRFRQASEAAEAVGYFLRQGRPGPCRVQPPPGAVDGVVLEDGSVLRADGTIDALEDAA